MIYQVLILNLPLSSLKVKLSSLLYIAPNLTTVFLKIYNETRTASFGRREEVNKMTKPTNTCHRFQENVQENLVRHYSILDIVSKFQETNARVNRALFRAVTDCGCIKIKASRQVLPDDCSFEDVRNHIQSHIEGQLCENCREVIEAEVGQNLFYLTGMCNALGLDLDDIICKEGQRVNTLGMFHLR